jgi:hypothetical protein
MVSASTEQATALTDLLDRARALGADHEPRAAEALSLYRDLSALLASVEPPEAAGGGAPRPSSPVDDVRRAAIAALRWQALLVRARSVRRLLGAEGGGDAGADLEDGIALLDAALALHRPDDADRAETLYLRDFLTLTARLAAADPRPVRGSIPVEVVPAGAPAAGTAPGDPVGAPPGAARDGASVGASRAQERRGRAPEGTAPQATAAQARVGQAADLQATATSARARDDAGRHPAARRTGQPQPEGGRPGPARRKRLPVTVVAVVGGCVAGLAAGLLLAPYLLGWYRAPSPMTPMEASTPASPASPTPALRSPAGPAATARPAPPSEVAASTVNTPSPAMSPRASAPGGVPGSRPTQRAQPEPRARPSPRPAPTPRAASPRSLQIQPARGPIVTLVIRSDPPGAEVFVAGVRQGRTPLAIQRPVGRPVSLTVRMGDVVRSRTIRLTGEAVQVVAVRLPGARPSASPRPAARPTGSAGASARTPDTGSSDTAPRPGPAPSPAAERSRERAPASKATAAPASSSPTGRFDQLMRQGLSLYQAGWYGPALARFRQATQVQPRSPRAWLWLGRAAFRAGRPAEARQALERVLSLAPGSAYAREAEGVLRWMRGRADGTP